jgi:L-ascorbate metabolism protein UlaG (beta-lactamase superfamily)
MKKHLFLLGIIALITGNMHAAKAAPEQVLKKISWLHHASFMIENRGKVIYIDPFEIKGLKQADFILITHDHPDHLSPSDIKKIYKKGTVIVCTKPCAEKLKQYLPKVVKPGDVFELGGIKCEAVPAYNNKKPFHKKDLEYAGYVLDIDGVRVYHAGDTDFTAEMKAMKNIGIAMLPIGGFFTEDVKEAAQAVAAIKPMIAVPMHFGYRIGAKKDGGLFKKLAGAHAKVVIMEEEEAK